MKFSDGFWLNRRGFTVNYAAQPYEVSVVRNSIRVFATSSQIYNRAMTLGGVTLEVVFSSTKKDTIKVHIVHHKGAANHEPKFELYEDPAFVPEIIDTETETILRSGKTEVKVTKGMEWKIEYLYDGKHLTGAGWRAASYIQENAYRAQERVASMRDDTFWSPPADRRSTYMREQLTLSVGEYIYGFGEKFTPFVKNGQTVETWNADGGTCSEQSYKCIPFYLSSRGYGVFTNQTGCVSYEVASDTVSKVSMTVAGESLEYYLIGGANCAEVLSNYTALTGRPALTPAKSMGLWLSTSFTTNYDENTVNGFLDGMAKRDIPLQMFHFDCFWMKGYTWTSFDWDTEQFPDPAGMLSRLKEKGLGVCVWINPYIAQESSLFDEGLEKGYFIHTRDGGVFQTDMWQPGMAIVDFTNPEAYAWFAGKIKQLCKQGVTAIKTDFGERIPTDVVYYDGSDPIAMHNYYTYLYNKCVFTALEECVGKDKACLFARSATAGGQKFPVHWGGDCAAEYSAMAETLRGGLSLTASGFGFFSHDIGGFEQTASPDVYKRWCAFGLMSTHSRLHGSTSYRVPWAYEEDDPQNPENACAVLRHFTKLKGKLMPYLWAQANHTHETGIPMMRAMVIDYAEDPTCLTLDRQYMLGESLLCAPVFDETGLAEFYLPEGEWFDLLSDSFSAPLTKGGRWIRRTCNYLQMPLYVRPNTILGLGDFEKDVVYDYLENATYLICGLEDGKTASCDIYAAEGEKWMTITAERIGNQITVRYPATEKQFTFCVAGTAIAVKADASGKTVIDL